MKTVTAKEIQQELVTMNEGKLAASRETEAQLRTKEEHAKRLQRIGFTQSRDTRAAADLDQARAHIALHERYARKYPGLKFIEEEVMRAVCQKYGLALGTVDRYKGSVPEWAAKAIEANLHLMRPYRPLRNGWGRKVTVKTRATVGQVVWTPDGAAVATETTGGDLVARRQQEPGMFQLGREHTPVATDHAVLMIAAPVADMDLRWNERVQDGRIVVKDDPIVCLHVDQGYVVLAAWGPEGQDPQVFNVKNN